MSETMNGEMPGIGKIVIANPLVDLLEKMLNDAKAGVISSIAIVAIGPQGSAAFGTVGPQRAELYVGADLLKDAIKAEMTKPSVPTGQRILRPMR